MAVSRTLQMDFTTELGSTYTITVYDAREDLTAAEVTTVMNHIVSKNIFTTNYGILTGKRGASVIDKETTELDV